MKTKKIFMDSCINFCDEDDEDQAAGTEGETEKTDECSGKSICGVCA